MTSRTSTLERAFQLADSGEFARVGDIIKRLETEKYLDVRGQLFGVSVRRDLKRRLDAARKPESATYS